MTQPKLLLTPRRQALKAEVSNTAEVLVQFQAPSKPKDAQFRSNLNISIVIDRSGSMSGEPIEEAKRCAKMVVDRLGPSDRAAIVAYDSRVLVLHPSEPVADRRRFHRSIDKIREGGATNLHGGWLAGAEQASPHISRDSVSRVILLSDGCANHGVTDIDEVVRQCAELAEAGVTTSTYGLGRHFNEDLMVPMAQSGLGNSYYGETAEDLSDPFMEEFDLLSDLFAKNLRLKISSPDGMRATNENKYPRSVGGAYRLPDTAYESEAWALFKVEVPETMTRDAGEGSLVEILTASVRYDDLDGEPRKVPGASLQLPVVSASEWMSMEDNELVARRSAEIEASILQEKARKAALHGDWDEVDRLLGIAESIGRDFEWLASVVGELRKLAREREPIFSKEARYASRRMSTRLSSVDETNFTLSAGPERSFLDRKSRQGRSSRRQVRR